MSSKVEYQQQIKDLQNTLPIYNPKDNEKFKKDIFQQVRVELEIDYIARNAIENLNRQESKEVMNDLLHLRSQIIQHIPVNGTTGDLCFFANMIQNVEPAHLCPAYNKMAVPTISTYHAIGSNISTIRLDLKALKFVPEEVLKIAGSLEGKQVDLFWTAIDGRFYKNTDPAFKNPLNNCTHPWAHPHALEGPEKIPGTDKDNPDSNIMFDVNMGIFPEIGYKKAHDAGAIAINKMSPMNVHVHARTYVHAAKQYQEMLFSPDNAHFNVIADSPFGIDWSIMQKDQRIALTKRLVIFDYKYPICEALLKATKGCYSLNSHLEGLNHVSTVIDKTFSPLIEELENTPKNALDLFHQLPPAFQYGIYGETWKIFNRPKNIHDDFGRASFEQDKNLQQAYQCNDQQRIQAVRQFAEHLTFLLVGSQYDLLFQAQSLIKGDNVLTMMKCAQVFGKFSKEEALASFYQLPPAAQEAVYFAFWQMRKCPRIKDFSLENFPKLWTQTAYVERAHAILIAASRQEPRFEKPVIIEDISEQEQPNLDLIPPCPQIEEPLSVKIDSPPAPLPIAPPASQLSVQEQLLNLAFDPDFQSKETQEKATQINQLISSLDIEMKNKFYGKIYENSINPHKGGEQWGEKHVADDLDVLILSINDLLG